jgi:hypothetical protein
MHVATVAGSDVDHIEAANVVGNLEGFQTAENPTGFVRLPTLEAQRSGVSGPKPPALSAELRAHISRSNRAEKWK